MEFSRKLSHHHTQIDELVLNLLIINFESKPRRIKSWIQSFPFHIGFVCNISQFNFYVSICCVIRSVHNGKIPEKCNNDEKIAIGFDENVCTHRQARIFTLTFAGMVKQLNFYSKKTNLIYTLQTIFYNYN